jgi:hypothetical protein
LHRDCVTLRRSSRALRDYSVGLCRRASELLRRSRLIKDGRTRRAAMTADDSAVERDGVGGPGEGFSEPTAHRASRGSEAKARRSLESS